MREFDAHKITRALISKGKDGWEPDDWRTSTENLGNLFDRYTLGQGSLPYTMHVEWIKDRFQATLTTCLSDKEYVGYHKTRESHAKRMAADSILQDPDVKTLFKCLPPKQGDIRSEAVLYTKEKRTCDACGVPPKVQHLIVRKRMDAVLEILHEMGYRINVWDGNV